MAHYWQHSWYHRRLRRGRNWVRVDEDWGWSRRAWNDDWDDCDDDWW